MAWIFCWGEMGSVLGDDICVALKKYYFQAEKIVLYLTKDNEGVTGEIP